MRRVGGVSVLSRLPKPPDGLSDAANAAWSQCGRLAIELGTLTRFDVPLLELASRTLGSVSELEQLLRVEGMIVASGEVRKAHPAAAMLERSRAQAHRLLADLGLTPPSRESLSIEPQHEQHSRLLSNPKYDKYF
jgi:P27 family predicted phage terminase small subunit